MMNRDEKKILVIDDDDRHLNMAREVLESEGYLVHTYAGGLGVPGIVCSFKPHLILLAMTMQGISCDDLAGFLQADECTRHIPIVFFSGLDEANVIKRTVKLMVQGHIRKGDFVELRSKVRYFLNMRCSEAINEAFSRRRLYAVE